MRILFIIVCVICFNISSWSQVGGRTAFDFVNLHSNAHISGIGGENVSTSGADPNMFHFNPAGLDTLQERRLSVNYLPFKAGVKKTDLSYVLPFRSFKGIGLGLQYINYGTFTETDEAGNELGTFSANEYAFTGGIAHQKGNISVGGNLKLAGSSIGGYTAFAIMVDMGAMFIHPDKDFQLGMVLKNFGGVIKHHAEEQGSSTPFDLQLGWSYKLEHMPLRFSMTAHHLHKWDVQFLDPSRSITLDDQGEDVIPTKSFGQKLFRHFVFGGEFLMTKGFNLRFGYNYLRRQELKIDERRGMTGFTFGTMIKVGWLEFNYSRVLYHLAGGTNSLTLTMDTHRMFKKKVVKSTEI